MCWFGVMMMEVEDEHGALSTPCCWSLMREVEAG